MRFNRKKICIKLERSDKNYLIVFLFCFSISWLCSIFYFNKDEFDVEYKEKGTAVATVFNIGSYEVVEELHDSREVNARDVDFIEYAYHVGGEKYESGSVYNDGSYSIGDEIEIEYVKSDLVNSRIKGVKIYRFNFFIRNLIMVSLFSFLGMMGVFYITDRL